VPGVDYAVGYYGLLTPAASATLPTFCTRTTFGGIPSVTCQGNGTTALDYKGIDNTGYRLDVYADTFTSVTIEDDLIKNGSSTDVSGDSCLIRLMDAGSIATNVTFQSITIQGAGFQQEIVQYLECDKRSAPNITTTVRYVACLQAPGKCFTPQAESGFWFDIQGSYIETINDPGGAHGEPWQIGNSGTTSGDHFYDKFNCFLQTASIINTGVETYNTNATTAAGSNVLHFAVGPTSAREFRTVLDFTKAPAAVIPQLTTMTNTGGTAPTLSANVVGAGVGNGDQVQFEIGGADAFEGEGPSGGTLNMTTITIDHDVMVANQWSQFTGFLGISKIMDGGPNATNFTITNLWVDPTGASSCFVWTATLTNQTISSNVNALTGGSITSLSGTC
jgi:hypothetical protein